MSQRVSRPRLTARRVRALRAPGKYYDVYGLYLRVGPTGRRYWEQRVTVRGRRRTFGLGPYPVVSLRAARAQALEHLRLARAGVDPLAERRRLAVPDFADAARRYIVLREQRWTSARVGAEWLGSLAHHAFPRLGAVPVDEIVAEDVVAVLDPLRAVSTRRLRTVWRRIRAVFDWCIGMDFCVENPAGADLEQLLDSVDPALITAHAAVVPADVGPVVHRVVHCDARLTTRLAFEFLVLTAARSGEARGARWDEVDLVGRVWRIGAHRMKARRPHVVPLSARALEVLAAAQALPEAGGFVFAATQRPELGPRPIASSTLATMLRHLGIPAVPHGFRASFRTWCAETAVPGAVAEACLAHVGDAYAREVPLGRRRRVFDDWAAYIAACAVAPPAPLSLLPAP